MAISTNFLSPFGCEISGVDLEQDLDCPTIETIRRLWIENGIVVLRGAGMSEAAHLRLSRCFGELQPAATKKLNLQSNPYLMALNQDEKTPINIYEIDGERRTGWLGWHWDQAFTPDIVRGAVLRMIDPGKLAGETGFIHGGDAYDRLPAALKAKIDSLEVVYHFRGAQEENRFGFPPDLKCVERAPDQAAFITRYKSEFPPVVHPLVITQPESGRKILKLSPMHAQSVLHMDKNESDELLAELAAHMVDRRYAYFHKWGEGDMVAWENWSVIHCANGVPPGIVRRAQRTTIIGDYKLGRYLDPATDGSQHKLRIAD
jgi:taurine dioxygenase